MSFAHLHVRSEFSLLEGVPSVKALVARAKALGYGVLALTDVNRMSGLILFLEACREAGIKPILGAEIVEAPRAGAAGRPGAGGPEVPVGRGARPEGVVILARNAEGYGDLCEIITRRQLEGAGFTLEKAFAREWPNLRMLTASPRHLKALAAGPNRARLHGELVRHCPESRARSREVEALCDAEGIPAAASGDVRFLEKADHEVHRILRAIDLNSTLSTPRSR